MAESGGGQGEYLIVARIRRPHGVRGELLIAVDTDRPRQVFRTDATLNLGDDRGRAAERTVRVERLRPTNNGAILKLSGIDSREGAEALRSRSLLIPASEAQPADAGEVHYRDLIGLTARADGEEVGVVEDFLELPGALTLVIRGTAGQELLVPFVSQMIADMDLETRTLTLKLPEGLREV